MRRSVDSDGARNAWLDFLSQSPSQFEYNAHVMSNSSSSSRFHTNIKDEPQDDYKPLDMADGMLPSPVSWDGNPRSDSAQNGTKAPLMAMDMDMDFDIRDMLRQ